MSGPFKMKGYSYPGKSPLKQDKKEFKGINWDTLDNVTVDGKTPKEIKKENLQKERDKWNQDLIDLRKLSDKKPKPDPRLKAPKEKGRDPEKPFTQEELLKGVGGVRTKKSPAKQGVYTKEGDKKAKAFKKQVIRESKEQKKSTISKAKEDIAWVTKRSDRQDYIKQEKKAARKKHKETKKAIKSGYRKAKRKAKTTETPTYTGSATGTSA